MKKSILFFAVFFAATFANAQITLLQSSSTILLGSKVEWYQKNSQSGDYEIRDKARIIGDYLVVDKTKESSQTLYIYNEDFNLVKSFTTAQLGVNSSEEALFISQNIFTNDGKWAWLRKKSGVDTQKYEIVSEDGQILTTLQDYYNLYSFFLTKVVDKYFLIGYNTSFLYDIYSLPGGIGETTDVGEESAPRNNARKYLHNDYVLIESDNKTFTIQGQEVK